MRPPGRRIVAHAVSTRLPDQILGFPRVDLGQRMV